MKHVVWANVNVCVAVFGLVIVLGGKAVHNDGMVIGGGIIALITIASVCTEFISKFISNRRSVNTSQEDK